MPKIEDAPTPIEVDKEVEVTEIEQPEEDRVDALEKVVLAQGEQIADIAEEQEKIVDILEKISDQVSSQKAENSVEEAEENEVEEKVENDISEESSEKETEESEEESEESEAKEEAEEEEAESEAEAVEEEEKSEETEEADEEVDNSISEEPEAEETEEEPEESEESEEETEEEDAEQKEPQETKENKMTDEQINALKEQIKNEILDAQVEAPAVEETEEEAKEPEVEKNWRKRYNDQIAAAWNAYRLHNIDAAQKLAKINKFNFEEKLAKNEAPEVMTIETADDFVLPYEVDQMIHGKRTNYSAILDAVDYATTDRLTFAYATREGDIDMQNVALCDDGDDGNLKPISTYELKKGVAQMEELAAVTPICDNATKYLAVDILSDVAAGYRNDYDRKLAQLVIVRMQQAVNNSGNTVEMEGETSIEKLVEFIKATTAVSDDVVNGTFVFNAKTKAQLVEYIFSAAAAGELGKDTMTTGEFPTIFGYPYIVVPNDLMPTLGAGDTKSFKAMNNETGVVDTVTISSPVFYGDLDEFRGKVSGGLKYDISAEAAYEAADGTVRSAWQRNELVLRGSFLRGGYIANQGAFAGLTPVSE